MDSKYNTNTENDIRNESQQLMVQELPVTELNNRQERNQSSNTHRPSLHQPSHQYQEMCEIQMDCEDKKSSRKGSVHSPFNSPFRNYIYFMQ